MGIAKLPPFERLRLLFLGVLLFPVKVLTAFSLIFFYYIICKLSKYFLAEQTRRKFTQEFGQRACMWLIYSIGFFQVRWVKLGNQQQASKQLEDGRIGGIVSNHVSWMDILLFIQRYFPAFVARAGTERIPVVGYISDMFGCLYIEREDLVKKKAGISVQLKQKMQSHFQDPESSNPCLIFPEGTTTNNSYLLPFKTGAFIAGLPLQPVVLKYEVGRVSAAWESIGAVRHLFLMLSNPTHKVTCYELPIYVPNQQEKEDPLLFAENVRKQMLEVGGFLSSQATLKDKRDYHKLLRSLEETNDSLQKQH
eukprot:TRINITY_DN5340_c0_g1_i7.p1 TRINITY_DN5340_c0_g1~~TRINITY_DN5340_c0_g1_i7.p1  ORF type:complete len:330 (-),score=29.63 TRINITY_DN5340_c0_g1_i7:570-1493(-)